MKQHDFTQQSTKQLFDLRRQMKSALQNPNCNILELPVLSTIAQIDAELETRGILSILKAKDVIYITNSIN